MAVAGVAHISASNKAVLVVLFDEFARLSQTAGLHVKLATSNHVNHCGGAELDELEVVRQHLLVSLALVLGVNAVRSFVRDLKFLMRVGCHVENVNCKRFFVQHVDLLSKRAIT